MPRSCIGIALVHRGASAYHELTDAHPGFAVAFRDEGVMLLQELAWIRSHHRIGCTRYGASRSAVRDAEASLRERTAAAFVAALARDRTLSDASLQWGIMLYEQAIDQPKPERLPLLLQAIERFQAAFPPDVGWGKSHDAWAQFRYGEALAATAEASPPDRRADLRKRATAAFCSSLALHPDDDGARKTTLRELYELGSPTACAPD